MKRPGFLAGGISVLVVLSGVVVIGAAMGWNRFRNTWVAMIKIDGQSIYLGSYEYFDEAVKARQKAENAFHFTGRV